MKAENITISLDETFMVEAIVSVERTPIEIMEVVDPLVGMIGITNLLEETRVKVVDSVYAPDESLMEAIFSSLAVPSSSNPP